jgi:hypothetical protein
MGIPVRMDPIDRQADRSGDVFSHAVNAARSPAAANDIRISVPEWRRSEEKP